MGNICRHPHDCTWLGRYWGAADGQYQGTFEDHHQRIEGSRVLAEGLALIEGEKRERPARGLAKHAARNAVFG